MTDNNEVRGSKTISAEPVAWITDTESADMHGWISCKAWSDGEFTTPLVLATDYAALLAERDALLAEVERLTRALEATTHLWESAGTELNSAEARAERLAEALRTAREYVAAELEAERDRFKGFEHCGGIEGMAEDLAAIDAAMAAEGRE